jgi:hypothetical protein
MDSKTVPSQADPEFVLRSSSIIKIVGVTATFFISKNVGMRGWESDEDPAEQST